MYLKLENNKEEKLNYLLDLLNHKDVSISDKERILLWTTTLINNISELEAETELIDFLLINNKVEVNWFNVNFVYKENDNSFSDSLLGFLNNQEIAKSLSSKILNSTENNLPAFRRDFLLNNNINDELYSSYIDAFPFVYGDLNFDILSKPKVISLIEKRKLSFNIENYVKLKESWSSLHLTLAVNNFSKFINEFSSLELSEPDFLEILKNPRLDGGSKNKLITLFEKDNTIAEIKTLNLIGNINLQYTALKLSEQTLTSILFKSSLSQNQKIELYVRDHSIYGNEFIPDFLDSLGGNYKQLNEKGPMPSFKNTKYLKIFFTHLKSIGYISSIKEKDEWIKVTTFRN